jgi:predicted ester cyclase
MSIEDNKSLVRRYYEQVVNTGNIDLVESFISPEYVENYDGERHAAGIEGAKEHILGVRMTYPDLHLTIDQQIAEGEWVATCITMRGTHLGSWLGIQPTGKPVVMTGVNIDRVVDGRIVEHGGAANIFEPLLRIGAVQVVGPQTE